MTIESLSHWDAGPPQIPVMSFPKASFNLAFGLPQQEIGCRDSLFPGRPEAGLKEA
jgi:hypothetical protein